MAYEKKDWDIVQAFYESGLSLNEIAERKEVKIKDRGSISRKAKQEGWIKSKMQHLVEKEIQAKQNLSEVEDEKATLNATQVNVVKTLVDEKFVWLDYLNKAALKNAQEAMKSSCANQLDYKHRADTIQKARDVIEPKNAMVQVNTQVNSAVDIPMDRYKQLVREVLSEI